VLPFDASALAHHRRLVGRMVAGDNRALEELYDLQVERVHLVVSRILRDREDVREVIQDTFVKAWRQASQYRPERGEVVAWLVFIARHAAIDRVRHGARRQAVLSALPAELARSHGPVEPLFDRREFLAEQLGQLTPPQRQALELAFFGGYSQDDIAQRMEMPVGNVKNHLRRGLLKLRQLTGRHDG